MGHKNLYTGKLIESVRDSIQDLYDEHISDQEFIRQIQERYQRFDLVKEFSPFFPRLTGEMTLPLYKEKIKPSTKKKNIKLQLFSLGANSVHAPHAHLDLVSIQTVLSGEIYMCEYTILEQSPSAFRLNLDYAGPVSKGAHSFATPKTAHWFGAMGKPAILLNLNITGAYKETHTISEMDPDAMGESRIYLDPTLPIGKISTARVITRAAADEKFSKRSPQSLFEG